MPKKKEKWEMVEHKGQPTVTQPKPTTPQSLFGPVQDGLTQLLADNKASVDLNLRVENSRGALEIKFQRKD